MTQAEWAWIVGFYEGEGSCCLNSNNGNPLLSVTIYQRDPSPLYWIKALLGGCVYKRMPCASSFSQNTIHVWSVASRKARNFLINALPLMKSKYKKSQVRRALRKDKQLVRPLGRKRRKDGTFRKRRQSHGA